MVIWIVFLSIIFVLQHIINIKSLIVFIDNININDYLLKISKDIVGVGMPFVDQKKPGPISNDIINDIYNKLK